MEPKLRVFWQYIGAKNILSRYFSAYGGIRALLFSPYLHIAFIFTIISAHSWIETAWFDMPIGALPSMLGFTLGGLAIWMSVGDESFRLFLSKYDPERGYKTPYVRASASFVHFFVIQVIALFFAICAKSLYYVFPYKIQFVGVDIIGFITNITPFFHAIGFFLFLYAILLGLAMALQIFRMICLFNKVRNHPEYKKSQDRH